MKAFKFIGGVALVFLVGIAIYFIIPLKKPIAKAPNSASDSIVMHRQMAELEVRAAAADKDVDKLLGIIEQMKQQRQDFDPGVLRGQISQRIEGAWKMWSSGRRDEAIAELLDCYERCPPSRRVDSLRRIIRDQLADFAKTDHAARQALAALRNSALQEIQSGYPRSDVVMSIAQINEHLGEQAATMKLYQALPEGDRRKTILQHTLFDTFIAEGRYEEAAHARSYSMMLQQMARYEQTSVPNSENDSVKRSYTAPLIKNIEVLVAGKQFDSAESYSQRLLRVDSSAPVVDALREALSRSPEGTRILQKLAPARQ